MAHLSMTFDQAVVVAATSVYHPLDGRGSVDTVAAGSAPSVEAQDLVGENTKVALLALDGYASAATTMSIHHGNGDVAHTAHLPITTFRDYNLGPDGLRLQGQWYVSFDTAATVYGNLLFDIL